MRGRRLAVLTTAAAAAVLLIASAGWACTNFVRIESVTPGVIQPASSASVRGVDAVARSTVELRWNRIDGPVLAVTQADGAGTFVAQIAVPNVTPGIYVLTATSEGHVARAAVHVGVADIAAQAGATTADRTRGRHGGGSALTILAAGLLLLASGAVVLAARRRPARMPATYAAAGNPIEGSSSVDYRLDDLVDVRG